MRPRGEVRAALAQAVQALAAVRGPVSAREAAAEAQVGYEVARLTLKDMARSVRPEVVRVGSAKAAGSREWRALYEPAGPGEPADLQDAGEVAVPQPWGGIEALAGVMRVLTQPI